MYFTAHVNKVCLPMHIRASRRDKGLGVVGGVEGWRVLVEGPPPPPPREVSRVGTFPSVSCGMVCGDGQVENQGSKLALRLRQEDRKVL